MARFVSLLPYLEDSALHKRRVDVWATCRWAGMQLAIADPVHHQPEAAPAVHVIYSKGDEEVLCSHELAAVRLFT
jgi:hypothetical protein